MRSMPSKSPLTALRDILHHIELAERFVTGFDNKAFLADVRTIYAVTRCLEVISEASRAVHLPPSHGVLPLPRSGQ